MLAFERSIERGFRFVADIGRDLRHAVARGGECAGAHLESPSRQICHGRLPQDVPEAFGEHCPRQAGLTRQLGNCPRVGVSMVKKSQRPLESARTLVDSEHLEVIGVRA